MQSITADDLRQRMATGETITLIDIREAYEHEEGHITDLNIPIADLAGRIEDLRAWSEKGDIVVYCRSGSRSLMAQRMLMVQYQLPNIINLEGGFAAWEEKE